MDDERKIVDEMDECLKTLCSSHSEKTVKMAKRLEELIAEYRSVCCDAILKNAANISSEIMKALRVCGVIIGTDNGVNHG